MSVPRPAVLVITDRHSAARPLDQVVTAALAGGCRWVSLREKDLTPEARLALLDRLKGPVRAAGATLTVHEDLAAASRVDGVHLPRDGDPAAARRVLGPEALIGVSAHDPTEAARAAAAGADYVTLSPIFASLSKRGHDRAVGLDGLAAAARTLDVPVVALGGIEARNAGQCRAAGAAGVAVCGAVMMAADPRAALSAVVDAMEHGEQ